jgi:hypothetical protein
MSEKKERGVWLNISHLDESAGLSVPCKVFPFRQAYWKTVLLSRGSIFVASREQ